MWREGGRRKGVIEGVVVGRRGGEELVGVGDVCGKRGKGLVGRGGKE